MAIGTVKWFNPVKGYGFIQPDAGGQDVFVHISAVEKAGYTSITEGLKIRYELLTTRAGKTAAAAAFACPAFDIVGESAFSAAECEHRKSGGQGIRLPALVRH